jgi:hypothetical protein
MKPIDMLNASDAQAAPRSVWTRFWERLREVSSGFCAIDIVVYALILTFGIIHLKYCASAKNGDDVFYIDSARSLLHNGFYGINGQAESNLPPGLSIFIAALSFFGSSSHVAILCAVAVLGTLGFIASYELLRRQVPRGIAAAICLLLVSSRVYFLAVSQSIYSCHPYFLTTMAALLVAFELERATKVWTRLILGALFALLLVASLMFASSAIAFLGAFVAAICMALVYDRRLAFHRFKTYFAILLVGVVAEGAWMRAAPVDASAGIAASEWPVEGFPRSYVAQLKVKSGNYPELGMATPRDLVVRVFENGCAHANMLSRMLLRRLPQLAWMSPFVAGPLLLVLVGWIYSLWRSKGGLQEWYFAGYEVVYLLWPWGLEDRFFLPIAPLACLYLWHGSSAVGAVAKRRPRLFGLLMFPISAALAVSSWFWMHGSGFGKRFDNTGLEDEFSFAVWSLLAVLTLWMIWSDSAWANPFSGIRRRYDDLLGAMKLNPSTVTRAVVTSAVAAFLAIGLLTQIEVGRSNVDPASQTNRLTGDAKAAIWVGQNTEPDAVIMARLVPTAFHYSNRKIVWFPPSSNPELLMDGIRKNRVDFVIVVSREDSYYLPPEDDCFAALQKTYPNSFQLVHQGDEFRVFKVAPKPPVVAKGSLGSMS